MKKDILYYASLIAVIAVLSVIMLIFIFWLYPYKTLEVYNQPFPLVSTELKTGDRIEYISKFCKFTNKSAILRGIIVGEGYRLELENAPQGGTGHVPKGCQTLTVSTFVVPNGVPQGKYHLEIVVEYKLNPVRNIEKVFETENFIIK